MLGVLRDVDLRGVEVVGGCVGARVGCVTDAASLCFEDVARAVAGVEGATVDWKERVERAGE